MLGAPLNKPLNGHEIARVAFVRRNQGLNALKEKCYVGSYRGSLLLLKHWLSSNALTTTLDASWNTILHASLT